MRASFLVAFLFCIVFVAIITTSTTLVDAQTIGPGVASTDLGNVVYTFTGVSSGECVFLYNDSDCTSAPALDSSSQHARTATDTLTVGLQATLDLSKLVNDTFYVCHATTCGGVFASIGTVEVIHTAYLSPGTLNIDQSNVTATMQHSPVGYSMFLLLAVAGGVKTGYGCRDIQGSGISMTYRTHITTIHGDQTVSLDIAHLTVGEYDICISDGYFANVADTPFLWLPQRVHLVKAKICLGGGISGICSVSPLYADKRVGTKTFTLYPGRPKTYAFLLRKDVCGSSTYTCSDNQATLEAAGYASPIGRLGFDRTIDIDLSGLLPGSSYVFCHRNVSSDTPPSFAPWHEVTAATLSISGGIDPTQTIVTCCGLGNTFVAGTGQWCTVYTYDDAGLPSGIPGDVCQLVARVTDTAGTAVCDTSPLQFRDTGRFEFSFVPTVAGLTTAGIDHFNFTEASTTSQKPITASIGAVVNVTHAAFDEANSVSSCAEVAGPATQCTITHRDKFGNLVGTSCTHSSGDTRYCNDALL